MSGSGFVPLSSSHISYEQHALLWESSGLNQNKYCEKHDLAYKQFVCARVKLKTLRTKTKNQKPKSKFIPVKPEDPTQMPSKTELIVLRLSGGGVIEIPASLRPEQLSIIFKSLGNAL